MHADEHDAGEIIDLEAVCEAGDDGINAAKRRSVKLAMVKFTNKIRKYEMKATMCLYLGALPGDFISEYDVQIASTILTYREAIF